MLHDPTGDEQPENPPADQDDAPPVVPLPLRTGLEQDLLQSQYADADEQARQALDRCPVGLDTGESRSDPNRVTVPWEPEKTAGETKRSETGHGQTGQPESTTAAPGRTAGNQPTCDHRHSAGAGTGHEGTRQVQELDGNHGEMTDSCRPEGLARAQDLWAAELPEQWMLRYVLNLQQYGVAAVACRRCGVSKRIVDDHANRVPAFKRAIAEAMETANDAIEAALRISAITGDLEPVYQGGCLVGYKRRKDVRAAELLLKAERPAKYRQDYEAPRTDRVILSSEEAVAAIVAAVMPKLVQGRVIENEP